MKDDGINTLAHGHKDIQTKLKKMFFQKKFFKKNLFEIIYILWHKFIQNGYNFFILQK